MAKVTARDPANHLLAVLPPRQLEMLLPLLTRTELSHREPIFGRGETIRHVHFPLNGVISLVSSNAEGVVEIATVGCEGMAGLPVFLGGDSSALEAFVQVPGESYRLKAADLRRLVRMGGRIFDVLQRYTQAFLLQIAQSVACGRLHGLEARCARWLLMTHDRVAGDEFSLTQEFLGQMLGVRRPQVSLAASALQREGLIRYTRGRIQILDRAGLEAISCECYRKVREEYERLMR
jgi:CRP-like cAMP-binding protein